MDQTYTQLKYNICYNQTKILAIESGSAIVKLKEPLEGEHATNVTEIMEKDQTKSQIGKVLCYLCDHDIPFQLKFKHVPRAGIKANLHNYLVIKQAVKAQEYVSQNHAMIFIRKMYLVYDESRLNEDQKKQIKEMMKKEEKNVSIDRLFDYAKEIARFGTNLCMVYFWDENLSISMNLFLIKTRFKFNRQCKKFGNLLKV